MILAENVSPHKKDEALIQQKCHIDKEHVQNEEIDATNEDAPQVAKTYLWDPSEPVATRVLHMTVWNNGTEVESLYYTHDLQKNVTALFGQAASRRAQHEHDPYGNPINTTGDAAGLNPYRYSSEYHDEDLGLIYYNYRHYNPTDGRWINRDPIAEQGGINLYGFMDNYVSDDVDILGLARLTFSQIVKYICNAYQHYLVINKTKSTNANCICPEDILVLLLKESNFDPDLAHDGAYGLGQLRKTSILDTLRIRKRYYSDFKSERITDLLIDMTETDITKKGKTTTLSYRNEALISILTKQGVFNVPFFGSLNIDNELVHQINIDIALILLIEKMGTSKDRECGLRKYYGSRNAKANEAYANSIIKGVKSLKKNLNILGDDCIDCATLQQKLNDLSEKEEKALFKEIDEIVHPRKSTAPTHPQKRKK